MPAKPLYYRWVYSPESGVTLGSNDDGHPAFVPYHQDLGAGAKGDRYHGYAYRIHNGWRLTDWESKPVEDPFVIAQVVRALKNEEPEEDAQPDFSRLHYGLPAQA